MKQVLPSAGRHKLTSKKNKAFPKLFLQDSNLLRLHSGQVPYLAQPLSSEPPPATPDALEATWGFTILTLWDMVQNFQYPQAAWRKRGASPKRPYRILDIHIKHIIEVSLSGL